MDLVHIYQCFSDRTRLRILHLLAESPLCVCHLQSILGEPQVKVSKHLAYLREKGLVEAKRDQNWMIYSLPPRRPPELEANLDCLRVCAPSDRTFARDLVKLEVLRKKCCERTTSVGGSKSDRRRDGQARPFASSRRSSATPQNWTAKLARNR